TPNSKATFIDSLHIDSAVFLKSLSSKISPIFAFVMADKGLKVTYQRNLLHLFSKIFSPCFVSIPASWLIEIIDEHSSLSQESTSPIYYITLQCCLIIPASSIVDCIYVALENTRSTPKISLNTSSLSTPLCMVSILTFLFKIGSNCFANCFVSLDLTQNNIN